MLQSYNVIVHHRKGQQKRNADGLSKMPLDGDPCFAPGEEERNVTGADELHSGLQIIVHLQFIFLPITRESPGRSLDD